MAEPDLVNVVSLDGKGGTIPRANLQRAIDEQGFREETTEETKERVLQQKYGGSEARALLEGAASSLTLGGYDVAARALGADIEGIRERRERSPIASGIGQVAGAIAPALLTGGAGAVGAAARVAPAGVASRIGVAAGRLAEGAAGRKVLGLAAQGAAEGAILGAGTGISEVALSDGPIDAERALATIGSNAL